MSEEMKENRTLLLNTIKYLSWWGMVFSTLIGIYNLAIIFLIGIETCSRFSHTRYLFHRIKFLRIKMFSEEKKDAKCDIVCTVAIILNFFVCIFLLEIIPDEPGYFIPRFLVGASMILIFLKMVNKWITDRGLL